MMQKSGALPVPTIEAKLSLTPILRATAILGSSSIASIGVGLVASKAWALLLGPAGFGLMGLMQSLLALVGLVAGLSGGTAIVREGAYALGRGEVRQMAILRRAAWLVFWLLGGTAVVILISFRVVVSQWMLGSDQYAGDVTLLSLALLFNLASSIQTSVLNAYRCVGALARAALINTVVGTAVSLTWVAIYHRDGIVWAILSGAIVSWGVSYYFLKNAVKPVAVQVEWAEVIKKAQSLVGFGLPLTFSMLVGAGVQQLMPVLTLGVLGPAAVGFYRAALTISVSYLGFLLIAMGQDYYPRLAATSDQPQALVQLVNQQHRLVMLLAVPMILGVLALAPVLVPLIYSPQFHPVVDLLEWQLLGDLFKFSSWTMAYVVLVRSSTRNFFFLEAVGGVTTLLCSWLGVHLFGLNGLGIGFLVSYIVYYLLTSFIVRRDIAHSWSRENKLMMGAAVIAALVIRCLPLFGFEPLRTPVAGALALAAGMFSLITLYNEWGGWSHATRVG